MTPEKRKQIELQIAQITCLLDCTYAGMAHDIKIVWRYGTGLDANGRSVDQSTIDYWKDRHGKHEEITVGTSDPYWGSKTVGHMLCEHLYHIRERLQDQLDEREHSDAYKKLAANW